MPKAVPPTKPRATASVRPAGEQDWGGERRRCCCVTCLSMASVKSPLHDFLQRWQTPLKPLPEHSVQKLVKGSKERTQGKRVSQLSVDGNRGLAHGACSEQRR